MRKWNKLRAEITRLKRINSDNEDFMAFMTGELAQFKCCHDDGGHASTPPMFWPELVACIAKRAVRDALAKEAKE